MAALRLTIALSHYDRHIPLFEEEQSLFGQDPSPDGIKPNRTNLERFMGYSLDQGFMEKEFAVEELFAESVLDT